jgi:hypothetical protein
MHSSKTSRTRPRWQRKRKGRRRSWLWRRPCFKRTERGFVIGRQITSKRGRSASKRGERNKKRTRTHIPSNPFWRNHFDGNRVDLDSAESGNEIILPPLLYELSFSLIYPSPSKRRADQRARARSARPHPALHQSPPTLPLAVVQEVAQRDHLPHLHATIAGKSG